MINVSNDKAEVESIKALDLTVAPYNQYGLMGCKAPYEMFNAIYKLDTPLLETDDPDHDEKLMAFKNTLATEHMKACGLPADKAKNYAENLIYTEKEIEDNPSQRHYIRLTTEPFETFKVKFDEAQGQEN